MTHDEARQFFFDHLPQVHSSGDLQRLTLWVLPYLRPGLNKPFRDIETMRLKVDLYRDTINTSLCNIGYNCDRNVSVQLRALQPLYQSGSSGPCFSNGYSSGHVHFPIDDHAKSFLGSFEDAHADVYAQLNEASTYKEWWTIFLEATPLWLRTSYNWQHPTPTQEKYLEKARTCMQAWIEPLNAGMYAKYNTGITTLGLNWRNVYDSVNDGIAIPSRTYWECIASGQTLLQIKCEPHHNSYDLHTTGFNADTMTCLHKHVHSICTINAHLLGEDSSIMKLRIF